MNPFRMRLTAAAVAVASVFARIAPAHAFQMPSSTGVVASNPVTEIQYRREFRRDRGGYYRGYRGYRDRRAGYRYYNGFWFPLAAFGAGALIGGAIQSERGGIGSRHVAWCESRYRSYRASDNTYVPRAGVRAQCVSPY